MSNLVSALLFLALVPCLPSAQLPAGNPCLEFAPENTIEWPPGGGFGTQVDFGRIVIAELDGDQAPDGVVNADGEAVAVWKIAVYDAPEPIEFPTKHAPTSIADLAALPGGGSNGTDAVLMTDNRGLFRVTYDTVAGKFSDPLIIPGPEWINAAPIHVDDVNGDGKLDVIGVAANKRSLLLCLNGPTGFVSQPPIAQPLDVREVVAADLASAHQGRELIALNARGLRMYSASGLLLSTATYISSTGCLARFTSSLGERLAWTRATGSGSQLAIVGASLLGGPPLPLTFGCSAGPIQPVAVLVGDYNADNKQDLLLVHEENSTAVVLVNLGSSPFFDTVNSTGHDVIQLSEAPSDGINVGIPAFGQLDGEEGLVGVVNPDDFAFPVTSTDTVQVHLTLPFNRAIVGAPVLRSSDIVRRQTEFGPEGTDPSGRLRFAFNVPTRYQNYDMLDMILWVQPGTWDTQTESTTMGTVETNGVSYRRHQLLSNQPEQWIRLDYAFQDGICWGLPPYDDPIFYTEFRFVKTTSPAAQSRIFTGGFKLRHCLPTVPPSYATDYAYLSGMGFSNVPPYWLYEENGLRPPPWIPMPKEQLGIYVPMSSQPPFTGGNPNPGEQLPGASAIDVDDPSGDG